MHFTATMVSGITYVQRLKAHSFCLPFRVSGYRLSVGFWFRRTKDVVNQPKQETVSIARCEAHIQPNLN